MFKIPGFNTQPAKYKSHGQVPQKVHHKDMDDSADELEDPGNEDVAAFQKIPESNTKQNHAMFLTRVASDSGQLFRHRSGSPFKEKYLNNQSHHRTMSRDHTTQALKKLLYHKSPKEAAQEYLDSSLKLKQQKQQNSSRQPKSNRASDSPPKFPFHSHNNSSTISNQENLSRAGDHTSSRVGLEHHHPEPASAYTELAQKIYVDRFLKKDSSRKTNVGLSPNSSKSQLLLSTNAALNVEEKRYLASKEIQDEITERLLKEGEIRDQHHKALASAYLSKEQEECTFSPSILTIAPRRNVNQFLEDQKQYQTQVEMKKKALQEQAQHAKLKDQGTFKPEICHTSAKMVAKKRQDSGPVYERLYNIGKNAHTKMMQNIAENGTDYYEGRGSVDSGNFVGPISPKDAYLIASGKSIQEKPAQNFIPTIDKKSKMIKRNDRIDHLLYSDALRRQHKMSEHTKSKSKSMSISTPGVSFTTKKATATRFIKEFDIAILEYLEEDKDPKLNYIQLNEFLRRLRFLKESEQFESPRFTPERLLLFDMWYILYGDKHKGIHRRNLLVFLLGVLNLHFPITKIQPQEHHHHRHSEDNSMTDMKKGDISPSELGPEHFINPGMPNNGERKVIGIFDDGVNYSLNEDEVRKVHKIYELWYLNRLSSADNIGQLINARNFEEHSHHPVTNESSKAMAQNYRERILENTVELISQNKIAAPRDGKLTHADLLNVTKKIAEEKVQKFGELMHGEEVKDCTFRPQTTQYGSMMTSPSMRSMRASTSDLRSPDSKRTNMLPMGGRERAMELYSLAKPRVLKRDKPSEEMEYEKNYDECTFHPHINHGRPKDSHDVEAKGADRAVDRVRNAHAEKSLQKFKKGRGNSTGSEGHFVFSLEKPSKFKKDSFVGKGSTMSSTSSRKKLHSSSISASDKKHHTSLNTYHLKSDENLHHHHSQSQSQSQSQQHHIHQNSVEEEAEDYGYDDQYEEDHHHHHHHHHHEQEQEEVHNQIQHHHHHHEEHEEHHEDQHHHEHHEEEERTPLLFVDVNLGQGRAERIIVREGDQSLQLAQQFCIEHNLDSGMISRLKELLDAQIAGLLTRIEEEGHSTPSETDRRGYQFSGGKIQEEDDYVEDDSYHHHHHHHQRR